MAADRYIEIGCIRIQSILRRLKIATMRTLEQKISDAGPSQQRVEPLHLTKARQRLEKRGIVIRERRPTGHWYRLVTTPDSECRQRLAQVEPLVAQMQNHRNHLAVGHTLEIATYRALRLEEPNHGLLFFGAFHGLESSDPADWSKEEPPSTISGRSLSGGKKLDFALVHAATGVAGVEVKNIREWVYPFSKTMRELLGKCCDLDAVPVMICRRYGYSTYSVLHRCGVLLFQNYNQLLPESLRGLADQVRDKDLLGYHDIRLGHNPNPRLRRFIGKHLPQLLPKMRARFDEYKDLLHKYASGDMGYKEFAARARRRSEGVSEDFDDFPDTE